ncbi:MAG TPA: SIS domain-containing protein [Bryobacteraceae bacterium]|nr:SIS domain-containing protein [Bryobacteraceae bacterium]
MATQIASETSPVSFSREYKSKLLEALDTVDLEEVGRAIALLKQARTANKHVFVCGNGGSASTASHFVCDMVKGASFERDSKFRIMALTDSMATITAYSNDVGYDCVFAEQLKNFAQPGDVFMAISGSGNSPNVVRAMEYATSAGCETIALTGRDGGALGPLAKVQIRVAEPHMGRIEDGHLVVCHMLCYYFMET